jgi:hypothetical protein
MVPERIIAAALVLVAAALGAAQFRPASSLAAPAPEALPLSTTPLPLHRDDPAITAIGPLRFLGAVQIRSSNPRFGGISGLRAGANGQFLAVTDTGNWLSFTTVERDGRLTGLAAARLGPIPDGNGKDSGKEAADAEALEWDAASGEAMVVYEQDHRIAHFTGIDPARPESLTQPPQRTERLTSMTGWASNGGGEAVAVFTLPGSSKARLILRETGGNPAGSPTGTREALLTRAPFTVASASSAIAIEGVDEHSPTDAVMLDGRRLLILHRRFNLKGVGAALSLVDLAPLSGPAPPARLPATLIARWQAPYTLDNMEALAIRHEGGRAFLYIASDENLSSLQRTLLMKFELVLP